MREAFLGGLLGLGSGALSVYSLWLITGFTARASRALRVAPRVERRSGWDPESEVAEAAPEGGGPSGTAPATLRVFVAFLLKAPILVAIALVAQSLGTVALYWCVGGVVLVYFLAVFWAAGQTNRR